MKYGIDNEINAVVTVTGRILPIMYPKLKCFEEGCLPVELNDSPFLIVSLVESIGYVDETNSRRYLVDLK